MTKLNTTIVIAFAALLMVMPLASSNAFAQEIVDGTAQIDAVCGISVSDSISFGLIAPGEDSEDRSITIDTSPSTVDGIQITAISTDWLGTAVPAKGTITVVDPKVGDTFVLGVRTYTGTSTVDDDEITPTTAKYFITNEDKTTASNIAAAITNTGDSSITATNDGTTNVVTITAVIAGPDGNSIALTSAQNTLDVNGVVSLEGGALGQVHLAAEVTKFALDLNVDVKDNLDLAYATKVQMSSSAAVELTAIGSPATDIGVHLQISTANKELQNMPYTGIITQQITFTADCGLT